MSLLSVVQTALQELNQPVPSTVVGNTDPNATLCYALANRSLSEMRRRVGAGDYWPWVRKQFLFNMLGIGPFSGTFTAGSATITGITGTNLAGVLPLWQVSSKYALNDTQVVSVNSGGGTAVMSEPATGSGTDTQLAFGQEAYPLPNDLDHFIPQTGWDRNFRWQLLGPVDAQEWQVLKSGISPVGPRLRYRLMAGQIFLNPAPYVPTGQSSPISDLIVMEYASRNCVSTGYSISGITQASSAVVTISNALAANPFSVGDTLKINGVAGMLQINDLNATVTAIGGTSGSYTATTNINSSAFTAYGSGGVIADMSQALSANYQADTDVSVLSEDLVIQALKWRWLRAKGLKYAEELDEFESNMDIVIGREQMPRALPLNAQASGIRLLNSQQIPDTGFGS